MVQVEVCIGSACYVKGANQVIQDLMKMIEENNLDVRTITMGISLLDCISSEVDTTCDNIYKKILAKAGKLVETGDEIVQINYQTVVNSN